MITASGHGDTLRNTGAPKFTAIMCTYNRPALMKEAVAALCRQTYQNMEIILINNGGTPETVEHLNHIAATDSRVILVNFEENVWTRDDPGMYVDVCFNAALNVATGDAENLFDILDIGSSIDQFDVIHSHHVLEHVYDIDQVLDNLYRALKIGGILLITVPQHKWLWSAVDENACHVRRYTHSELVRKVTQSGFTVNYVTSFVSLLVPLMWLSRLRNKSRSTKPVDEFHISSWLNRLLEMIMSFELGLLKIGMRLPFGGSLLLMASKKK